MAGPLAKVATLTAGISLDVSRKLSFGRGITMRFIVPDTVEVSGWRTVRLVTKSFDRISGDEETRGDGSSVIFQVAETKANPALAATMRFKDLHVEVQSQIYSVAFVSPVAPNEAQVYTLTCKTRTLRDKFFDNKR